MKILQNISAHHSLFEKYSGSEKEALQLLEKVFVEAAFKRLHSTYLVNIPKFIVFVGNKCRTCKY